MATTEHLAGAASKLRVEYAPIDSLRHAEYNPRVINTETKEPVRKSVEIYGTVDPLIVNRAPGREGIVIGGNLRLEALEEMGFAEAPVIYRRCTLRSSSTAGRSSRARSA